VEATSAAAAEIARAESLGGIPPQVLPYLVAAMFGRLPRELAVVAAASAKDAPPAAIGTVAALAVARAIVAELEAGFTVRPSAPSVN
jgi:hypothetical protein